MTTVMSDKSTVVSQLSKRWGSSNWVTLRYIMKLASAEPLTQVAIKQPLSTYVALHFRIN